MGREKGYLLHNAGEQIFNIYSSLTDKTNLTYENTIKQINGYFTPKKSTEFEVFKFRSCTQSENESIDEYYGSLRNLSENCEFHTLN